MNDSRETPLVDFSEDPEVLEASNRERRNKVIFGGLAITGAAALLAFALGDGFEAIDVLAIAIAGLALLWGVFALLATRDFAATHPGLKVYREGLALPWRSPKAAAAGQENLLRFSEISEIKVVKRNGRAEVYVVYSESGSLREFPLESRWIPDFEKFLKGLESRVQVRHVKMRRP